MSEQNDVAMATEIKIGSCNCPSVHILLKDGHGAVLAGIALPPETARALANGILDLVDEIRTRKAGDAIGQCEGHA